MMVHQVGPALQKPVRGQASLSRQTDWEGVREIHQGQERTRSKKKPDTWLHPITESQNLKFFLAVQGESIHGLEDC